MRSCEVANPCPKSTVPECSSSKTHALEKTLCLADCVKSVGCLLVCHGFRGPQRYRKIYVHIYIYVCVSVYIYIHICIYIYIYTINKTCLYDVKLLLWHLPTPAQERGLVDRNDFLKSLIRSIVLGRNRPCSVSTSQPRLLGTLCSTVGPFKVW